MKFKLEPAGIGKHKYVGVFIDGDKKETRIPFGARGYEDYTQHKNILRQKLYLLRHAAREDWKDPMTAGALSRWILWNTPNLQTNVRLYKQKFNLD